jgi:ABC-type molybdate transport system permease subunit
MIQTELSLLLNDILFKRRNLTPTKTIAFIRVLGETGFCLVVMFAFMFMMETNNLFLWLFTLHSLNKYCHAASHCLLFMQLSRTIGSVSQYVKDKI